MLQQGCGAQRRYLREADADIVRTAPVYNLHVRRLLLLGRRSARRWLLRHIGGEKVTDHVELVLGDANANAASGWRGGA